MARSSDQVVGRAQREGGVGPVHDGLVGEAPGVEGRRPAGHRRPGLGVRPDLRGGPRRARGRSRTATGPARPDRRRLPRSGSGRRAVARSRWVRTMVAAQRCPPPRWRTSWPTSQPGQLGTGVVRSAPRARRPSRRPGRRSRRSTARRSARRRGCQAVMCARMRSAQPSGSSSQGRWPPCGITCSSASPSDCHERFPTRTSPNGSSAPQITRVGATDRREQVAGEGERGVGSPARADQLGEHRGVVGEGGRVGLQRAVPVHQVRRDLPGRQAVPVTDLPQRHRRAPLVGGQPADHVPHR